MAALGSDRLSHVTVADEEAYTALVAHCLPILRVEKSLPAGNRCVIWRNEPRPDEQMKANRLIGAATHAW